MDVLVVESPAKAKTINKYLGPDYTVLATYGHVRDLPPKDGSVRPDEDFAMDWEVDGQRQKRLDAIAKALQAAPTSSILATDPDREGEAISWHVQRGAEAQARRWKASTSSASSSTRSPSSAVLDADRRIRATSTSELVDAYLARRALDYLVGFTLSPVLWRKLPGSRSAGRVQSVALRLICEREAEIEAFKRPRILDGRGRVPAPPRSRRFTARLTHLDGKQARQVRPRRRGSARARPSARSSAAPSRVASVERKPGPAQPAAALHHLDPAAGSLAQARLRRQPRPCASRSGSTKASISAARRSA